MVLIRFAIAEHRQRQSTDLALTLRSKH